MSHPVRGPLPYVTLNIRTTEGALMSVGGGGPTDDAFLIGPFMEWWDKRSAKRDAKRTAKAEARAQRSGTQSTSDDAKESPPPSM